MDTLSFCVVVALVCTAGCASTHVVDSDHPEQWILPAQEQLVGEDVVVRTVDGRRCTGTLSLLGPDSLRLNDDEGRAIVMEELSNVTYVGERRNGAAPIAGCLGGVFFGGIIGATVASSQTGGFDSINQAVTIGAVFGGVAGLTIGGLASTVDQYEIHQGGKRATGNREPGQEKK